ncbi:LPXTG cell wall anchor domain-containing protein [Salipaludibacillus sp. CUR1]|uniref:DUF6612 family protein n=1 Tax=Salipaludibacillus sp. CUR1 TaxID=2820003 RepID=UPI001E503C44|nr:DUF6612 family protein [Salipaludibacillus sp. CUR1]MCE7794482.1 LPXTG cell wall anchor domain-containing protein [Salipaludibacillus sp. CUR1]
MVKKKKLTGMSALYLSVLLIGANSVVADDEMTAGDVLDRSNEAMDSLESFSSTTELYQLISDEVTGEMEFNSEIEQDVIVDPFKMRQVTTTIMPDGETETLTSYMSEEGYFMEDHDGGWIKVADGTDIMDAMTYHPNDQVEELEGYYEDLTLSKEDNYYVITYDGDGEELTAIMEQAMSDLSDEDMDMMEGMMGDIQVNDFSYELFIDMDTYYLSNMNLHLDMDIAAEGESASIEQMMEMSFHNFDGVEDFDIPEEALEDAQDVEEIIEEELEEAEEGGELPETATNNPMMAAGALALALAAGGMLVVRRRTHNV